ncbi:MAG: ThuA domain-containing protein [Chitinophagaceae bacterium]|nr:ThuA domain-containing protein [Chitinophagaceae bacterium]
MIRHPITFLILVLLPVLRLTPPPENEHIVFLISEDENNYDAHKTIPAFAEKIRKESNYDVSVLLGKGSHGAFSYPKFNKLSDADLVVIFSRRVALPHEQMNSLKSFLGKGKPLVGIRTANHAFNVREKIEEGFEEWPAFPADILGCENRGYGPTEPGTNVSVQSEVANHPIVKNLSSHWHSKGNVYLVAPLIDSSAVVLLAGTADNTTQPIAWTRKAGNSKIFYTSLGHPSDFSNKDFLMLLSNSIRWALSKEN